jgi:hypothetical protein
MFSSWQSKREHGGPSDHGHVLLSVYLIRHGRGGDAAALRVRVTETTRYFDTCFPVRASNAKKSPTPPEPWKITSPPEYTFVTIRRPLFRLPTM